MIDKIRKSIQDILTAKKKEDARRIVLNAEVLAAMRKINVMDILENYVKYVTSKHRKPNEYVVYVIKNKDRLPKSELYKSFLDNDAMQLLKLGEAQGVGTSSILREYFETSNIIKKGMDKIQGAITKPLIMYVLVSLIGYYIIHTILKQMHSMNMKEGLSTLTTIQVIYFPVIILIGLLVYIPLTKYPHKIPKLKDAYNVINGYKYGNIMLFFLSLGLSVNDIEQSFRKSIKRYKSRKKGFEGLAEFLEQYFDDVEIASIKLGIELNQFDSILRAVIEDKRSTFDKVIEQAVAFLSEALILLSMIPAVLVMIGMYEITVAVMSLMSSATH